MDYNWLLTATTEWRCSRSGPKIHPHQCHAQDLGNDNVGEAMDRRRFPGALNTPDGLNDVPEAGRGRESP